MKKCPFCAEEIQDEAIKCKHCGELLNGSKNNAPHEVVLLRTKNPNTATFLSFIIPGVGQFYNGHLWKGFFILVVYVAGMFLLFIPSLCMWIIAMVDANQSAKAINQRIQETHEGKK